MNPSILTGYYPKKIEIIKQQVFVQLKKIPEKVFKSPFLHKGVKENFEEDNKANLVLLHLEELIELSKKIPAIPLNGVIFHMSRCGSTLTNQVLSELNQSRAVGEPEVFGQLTHLILKKEIKERDSEILFRCLIKIFGQNFQNNLHYYFIKFSNGDNMYLNFFSKYYPNLPIIFITRNPLEVMVSLMEGPTTFINKRKITPERAALKFNLSEEEIENMLQENFIAKMMQMSLRYIIDNFESKHLFIDHKEMPKVIFDKVLPHFKINYTVDESQRMQARANYHGKKLGVKYRSDVKSKLNRVTPTMKIAIEKFVLTDFEYLQRLIDKSN